MVGEKKVKVKIVYGFGYSTSVDDFVWDSRIGNMNRIFMNEANVVVTKCNV